MSQCWVENVGPPSTKSAQHQPNTGSMSYLPEIFSMQRYEDANRQTSTFIQCQFSAVFFVCEVGLTLNQHWVNVLWLLVLLVLCENTQTGMQASMYWYLTLCQCSKRFHVSTYLSDHVNTTIVPLDYAVLF